MYYNHSMWTRGAVTATSLLVKSFDLGGFLGNLGRVLGDLGGFLGNLGSLMATFLVTLDLLGPFGHSGTI